MNILWLSWRDIKNPQGGGAEKVAIEVSKRFVRNGSNVTIFTSSFKQSKPHEKINGVNIIRRGNQLTCRLHAYLYYRKNPNFDLVIDEINTIPFFTNFYAKSKSVCLIHQLAKEYWFSNLVQPFSTFGFLLENLSLIPYREIPTITVSKSTKKDLQKLGFKKVTIISEGLDIKPSYPINKKNQILFLGRLVKIKGPEDAILAFSLIEKEFPDFKFIIAGKDKNGYTKKLKYLSIKLNLSQKITFLGYVDAKTKNSLLRYSKIILIPSIREGWGLVATEAQAMGTVPIAYNVNGLRDSIQNNKTGLLTQHNPNSLAMAAIQLIKNEGLRKKIAYHGYIFSKQFSWKKTYNQFKKVVIIPKMD